MLCMPFPRCYITNNFFLFTCYKTKLNFSVVGEKRYGLWTRTAGLFTRSCESRVPQLVLSDGRSRLVSGNFLSFSRSRHLQETISNIQRMYAERFFWMKIEKHQGVKIFTLVTRWVIMSHMPGEIEPTIGQIEPNIGNLRKLGRTHNSSLGGGNFWWPSMISYQLSSWMSAITKNHK